MSEADRSDAVQRQQLIGWLCLLCEVPSPEQSSQLTEFQMSVPWLIGEGTSAMCGGGGITGARKQVVFSRAARLVSFPVAALAAGTVGAYTVSLEACPGASFSSMGSYL